MRQSHTFETHLADNGGGNNTKNLIYPIPMCLLYIELGYRYPYCVIIEMNNFKNDL